MARILLALMEPANPHAEKTLRVSLGGRWYYTQIADLTAPFVYARIMGTTEAQPEGYAPAELDHWAQRARTWAEGAMPDDLEPVSPGPPESQPRDVFLYVISGDKVRNPAAAMALTHRLAAEG